MSADRIDAFLWFAIPCVLLTIFPIGFASNDGVGHSLAFAAGRWGLNPNHLLFEPLGAWWQNMLMALGYPREPFDALKLLSVFSGSVAIGLFRTCVAPRVSATRFQANHATAWMAFSSAFLRLWVSDEIHMIQMPAVTAMVWTTLRYLERRTFVRGLLLGVATGVAALTFISNLLLGAALAGMLIARHLWRRELAAAISIAASSSLGILVTSVPPLLLAWSATGRNAAFFDWLTRYGGGQVPPRIHDAYGITADLSGLLEALVRAAYGAASAVVDLTRLGAAVRDRQQPDVVVVCVVLMMLAAAILLLYAFREAVARRATITYRNVLLISIPLVLSIGLFGIFWNNSDDQFYFQLAVVVGILVTLIPAGVDRTSRIILALSGLALLWNIGDVAAQRLFYPRQERIAMLERETNGACLVVTAGFDEAELLLAISHRVTAPRMSLTRLAATSAPQPGMASLSSRIDRCLRSGERVVFIDVFDTPRDRNPWKFLRRLGYERTAVETVLARFPMDPTRRVGPFRVRTSGERLH